jgi:hypothetical protein
MDARRAEFAYHMEVLSNLFYLTNIEAEHPAKVSLFMCEAQIHLKALAGLLLGDEDKNLPQA